MTVSGIRSLSRAGATADINLHLLSTSQPEPDGRFFVDTTTIQFGADYKDGGYVNRYEYRPNGDVMAHARHISGSAKERAAAQAVQDAVKASGLLEHAVKSPDIAKPAPGMTRLYLDKRSYMVEYPNGKPDAATQSVLDAINAYTA